MSVREEDRRKNSCPSRGLGLAAAAIGVGVGAALYYFFSKRPENPDSEGSTSQGWSCEQPQALDISSSSNKSDYTTISEHSTTDTSIHDDGTGFFTSNSFYSYSKCNRCNRNNDSIISIDSTSVSEMDISDEDHNDSFDHYDDELSLETTEDDEFETGSESGSSSDYLSDNDSDTSSETGYITLQTTNSDNYRSSFNTNMTLSDSDMDNDWDVTNSSQGIPRGNNRSRHIQMMQSLFSQITDLVSPSHPNRHSSEDDQMRIIREQAFRERAWSLEECSICFEVMLKDQPLMALPCTHNFHVQCIGPWLQEQQTCPVCRKAAE